MLPDIYFIKRIIYKFQDKLLPRPKPFPENQKELIDIPLEDQKISVETALNSRCSSDYDDNPHKFHWGMFDRTKKLSDEQISKLISMAVIPRFTKLPIKVNPSGNTLTFSIDANLAGIHRDWVMIESGMQQQAISLVCAGLGVGHVLKSLGEEGCRLSETEWGIVKMKLGPMKASYSDSFWTIEAPCGTRPWKRGNLSDPSREGGKPLMAILKAVRSSKKGEKTTYESISQLLWAAKGRTPHFYKSQPWGLTIPTFGGKQNISSVYLLSNYWLYKYVNWHKNRPTHSLVNLRKINVHLWSKLTSIFENFNIIIVLAKNKSFSIALWEVGYQLLNLLVQATALNLYYKAVLLNKEQRRVFQEINIQKAIAVLLLRG